MENNRDGIIQTTKEVACYRCGQWRLGLSKNINRAKKELFGMGWRQLHGRWHCPRCAAEKNPGKAML